MIIPVWLKFINLFQSLLLFPQICYKILISSLLYTCFQTLMKLVNPHQTQLFQKKKHIDLPSPKFILPIKQVENHNLHIVHPTKKAGKFNPNPNLSKVQKENPSIT